MTKREIADFFGWKAVVDLNKAFVAAEPYCESLRIKKGHYNKNMTVDYTLEETLIALEHITPRIKITPIRIRLLKEAFIHRDLPYVKKQKKITIPYQAKNYLYLKRIMGRPVVCCCNCQYMIPKTPNRPDQKRQPYCNFHQYLLNKKLPKINIYMETCPFYVATENRIATIFTSAGPVSEENISNFYDVKLDNSTMMGIPNSDFKSKRKRGEPVIILKDGFDY